MCIKVSESSTPPGISCGRELRKSGGSANFVDERRNFTVETRKIRIVTSTRADWGLLSGECRTVIWDIERGRGAIDKDNYEIPDIYEQYEDLK